MALEEYRRKRRFTTTPEPRGQATRKRQSNLSFVVQKHDASRLHYDFRLELDGVLKSWAVPKGPSLDPADKRLAVHVEDHPIEYGGFEGTIPEGEYGGGTVMLWDRGTWEPLGDDPAKDYAKGHLKFILHGARLKGAWALVRMGGPRNADGKNWLLIKERDAVAKPGEGGALVTRFERSVASRRSMDGIAKAKDSVRHSNKRSSAMLARAERLAERAAPTPPPRPRVADIAGARAQRLPAKPLPALATLAEAAPEGDDWLHEVKLDGYRMLARIKGGEITMLSRNGIDWTGRFPRIEAALGALKLRDAVIDGEVVHLQPNGVSSFSALKDDLSAKTTDDLVYYAFDLLHLDGKSLEPAPLTARKAALAALLPAGAAGPVRLSEHVVGHGGKVFAKACKLGLEGIVSKRCDAPYRAGRNRDWLKVKCVQREEFIVLGWTDPAGKRSGFGALLLGYWDAAKELHYAGAVGTGFTAQRLDELRTQLDRLAQPKSASAEAAKEAPRGAHWVKPSLVAEIQYAEWTSDGRLRHPSFLGLREDKEAKEVIRERAGPAAPAAKAATKTARRDADTVAGVRLTHPQKPLYAEQGITKLDLAQYYEAVADRMLPHLQGRPLTLVRCPAGAGGKCFYQKHPGEGVPAVLQRIAIEEKEGTTTYLIADDVAGLISLVQMGVLEIHVWGSTRRALEQPDRVIIDLDPDEGLAWERVIEGALAARDLLAEMGLTSFAKATGGKGLHVVVPLRPKYDWDAVKQFAHGIADELVRRHPESYTGSLPKAARRGKIFVDYLRNQRGATAIAPFSSRARPGAPVSAPLSWAEVEKGVRSDAFTIATLPQRLARQRSDPWREIFEIKQTLPASVMRKLG